MTKKSFIVIFLGSLFPLKIGENAHVAQSVEHFLGKEVVTGSTPVVGLLDNKELKKPQRWRRGFLAIFIFYFCNLL